jgi:hypothetical protein
MSPIAPIILASIIAPSDNAMWQMNSQAYDNPAVKQWMLPMTHNSIDLSYHKDKSDETIDFPGEGTGTDYWQAEANSYMKYKTSTLWGGASYRNGKVRNVKWNETSDAALIYPYFTADSVGGNMSMEQYAFNGGYADQTDKWAWGGTIGYTAGLYYRNVDPRPRNVTGKLNIALGGGAKLWQGSYFAGASVNWMKYKQSNDIDFKSQTGVEKIYHLTGLGTHYSRFAGTGTDVYYTGNRLGATFNIFPVGGSGVVASANISRFKFDKILTDLNKLPMATANHKQLDVQVGWLQYGRVNDWAVTATLQAYRRHGLENIFGDASSSIYPQIGQLLMYADNSISAGLSGLWQRKWSDKMLLWIRPDVAYDHRTTAYRDPARFITINNATVGATAEFTSRLSQKWSAALSAGYHLTKPFDTAIDLSGTGENLEGLLSGINRSYTFASDNAERIMLEAKVSRAINRQTALILSIDWQHTSYCDNVRRNDIDVNLAITF